MEDYLVEHATRELQIRGTGIAEFFKFEFGVVGGVRDEFFLVDILVVDGCTFDDYSAGEAGGVADEFAGVDVFGDGLLELGVEGAQLIAELSGEVCESEEDHGGDGRSRIPVSSAREFRKKPPAIFPISPSADSPISSRVVVCPRVLPMRRSTSPKATCGG